MIHHKKNLPVVILQKIVVILGAVIYFAGQLRVYTQQHLEVNYIA